MPRKPSTSVDVVGRPWAASAGDRTSEPKIPLKFHSRTILGFLGIQRRVQEAWELSRSLRAAASRRLAWLCMLMMTTWHAPVIPCLHLADGHDATRVVGGNLPYYLAAPSRRWRPRARTGANSGEPTANSRVWCLFGEDSAGTRTSHRVTTR